MNEILTKQGTKENLFARNHFNEYYRIMIDKVFFENDKLFYRKHIYGKLIS